MILGRAGLLDDVGPASGDRYRLSDDAKALLIHRDRLGGRDAVEALLDGGWWFDFIVAMWQASESTGLAWDSRYELITTVGQFADPEWQVGVWADGKAPPGVIADFDESVEYFSDLGFDELGAHSGNGLILHDSKKPEPSTT